MENPLTGKLMPITFKVDIYNGKHIITSMTIRTTSEEEAVAQAAKQLKTKVKRIYE